MSFPTSQQRMSTPENRAILQAACLELRQYLARAKRSVDDEIASYPKPIPRCDAQFNYLYEQRSRLSQELERATSGLAEASSMDGLVSLIMNFVDSASCSGDTEEQDLKARLRAKLARLV